MEQGSVQGLHHSERSIIYFSCPVAQPHTFSFNTSRKGATSREVLVLW